MSVLKLNIINHQETALNQTWLLNSVPRNVVQKYVISSDQLSGEMKSI